MTITVVCQSPDVIDLTRDEQAERAERLAQQTARDHELALDMVRQASEDAEKASLLRAEQEQADVKIAMAMQAEEDKLQAEQHGAYQASADEVDDDEADEEKQHLTKQHVNVGSSPLCHPL